RPVPQPALALVALRTIGRDASVVAAHAPHDVLVYAIQQRIGAGEVARALQRIVNYLTFERGQARPARIPSYLDEAKPVVSEAGLVHFRAPALQCVSIRDLGRADVIEIERAVGLKRLGVAHRNLCSARAGHLELAPANYVLAHVEYPYARLRLREGNGFQRLHDANWRDHLRRKNAPRVGDPLSRLPLRSIKSRRAPAGHFLARVIFFAVVFIVGANRAIRGETPGAFAGNRLGHAVLILDAHLEQEFGIPVTRRARRHRR